jgi:hypothetical protein
MFGEKGENISYHLFFVAAKLGFPASIHVSMVFLPTNVDDNLLIKKKVLKDKDTEKPMQISLLGNAEISIIV